MSKAGDNKLTRTRQFMAIAVPFCIMLVGGATWVATMTGRVDAAESISRENGKILVPLRTNMAEVQAQIRSMEVALSNLSDSVTSLSGQSRGVEVAVADVRARMQVFQDTQGQMLRVLTQLNDKIPKIEE